jgi:hypothetical protein
MKAPKTILDVLTGLFAPLFPAKTWRPWVLIVGSAVGNVRLVSQRGSGRSMHHQPLEQ